ncbi:hypothetical protein Rhopal_000117-T1 [Rhodotorula paludigena]|uniref:Proteophosphoglycan ppg4 n=1 Tax=Rhodotorula paludigena TaxID=86838 RepID=A0AAV5GDL0_9BASI|nr:hypothetical protein Rhopal_000117-T1 [Rhodotorula paludigena]
MQAAAPFPSVLLQAPPGTAPPHSAPPPPRLPTQRPRAQTPPVPADWIRCSQCKKHKDPSAFPVRLINLIPYQVCLAHDWYWTEAKRATHWAPTTTISWAGLCDAARQLRADQTGAQGKWRVSGRASERESLVDRISRAGGWTAKEIPFRQSTAKNDSLPSPTWIYSLEPTASSSSNPSSFKLQLWAHDSIGCYTITLVPSTKGKEVSAWARPGRARKPKSAAAPVDVETGQPARKSESAAAPSGDAPGMAALLAAAAQTASAATSTSSSKRRSTSSVPSADRDREQMPPPPVPKKPRRVEPLLVSPNPTFSSSGPNSQTPFAAAAADQSWAHLFSFPTLQLPSAPPAASSASDPFPLDPLLTAAPGSSDAAPLPVGALPAFPPAASSSSSSRAPHSGSLQLDPNRPLTLAELLSSAIFEPPNIDLPPRLPAHNAASSSSIFTARTSSRSRRPAHTAARVRTKAGKELDEAVADALGNATPPVSAAGADEEGALSEEEGEGYYEDSIPDESSEEEDDDEEDEELLEGDTPGGGADGASVSSFFESSAEETDYGSARPGDDESDEDGEDNWLEGFAAQQMGLTRGETDDEEDEEEDEEDEGGDDGGEAGEGERSRDEVSAFEEDEENDELSDGEVVATTTRALDDRRAARAATRAAGVQDAEDEVDELDSPSGDEGP